VAAPSQRGAPPLQSRNSITILWETRQTGRESPAGITETDVLPRHRLFALATLLAALPLAAQALECSAGGATVGTLVLSEGKYQFTSATAGDPATGAGAISAEGKVSGPLNFGLGLLTAEIAGDGTVSFSNEFGVAMVCR
jgi:hypothetical protein